MDFKENRYKIPIKGRWDLKDLYVYPKTYEQVYFLIYSLLPHEDKFIIERIQNAYLHFPGQGGYNTTIFFNDLLFSIPDKQRPHVISLQYGSPGWIELSLIMSVALTIEKMIKKIAPIIREFNSVYDEIRQDSLRRKLLGIEVKSKELELQRKYDDFIEESIDKMTIMLSLKDTRQMTIKTGIPLKTLKILLYLHRKIRTLLEYQNNGKTNF